MSQSLYTSMSGIAAATKSLEVISNNVANINTTAFKSSSVNFSDVYSTTISYGSVSSGDNGGTNPIQVGVGTQVSAISKDFTTGSANSTGESNDLMIQGSGFFTVTDGDQNYLTRAGDFSWDDDGNLVTSSGYKVIGTDNILSTISSKETVYVPTSIIPVVEGNTDLGDRAVSELNSVDKDLTAGTITIVATDASGTDGKVTYNIELESTDLDGDVNELIDAIQDDIGTVADTGIKVGVSDDGKITFTVSGSSTTGATALTFGATGDTSNIVAQTELSNATIDDDGVYSTKTLDYTASITDVTSAAESTSINSIAIGLDGSIQATYANGDTLSVELGADGETYDFVYTTKAGAIITGDSLDVSENVAVPANFVIQLATVTNTDGLLSVGSNLYEAGPNSGDIVYTVGGEMGAGEIASGYLEASNVDLSEELSNMILAQRAIQANSRVFTTVSDTMDTVVNMGR